MLKRIAAGLILAVAMVSGVAAGQIEDADAAWESYSKASERH